MTLAAAQATEPLPIVAEGLRRTFGAVTALGGLSLQVARGEIYGLVGSDGAGKTTTMRILAGMIAPDAGSARVLGQDPLGSSSSLRSSIGYMPQHYSLYGDLTVEENLRFFSRMFCQGRAEYLERRARLLEITRLARFADRRADALSGGMYKKLALACSLLPRPEVLLLDEPTNGVDPISRRELWALLFDLVREGMSILVTTAYMDEAARCHRVGLIHGGQLLLEGRPAALLASFGHVVLEIHSPADRAERIERLLEAHPAVLALSASGARLKAVVRQAGLEALGHLLAEAGAATRPAAPTFEEVFLAAIQSAGGAA